MDKNELICEKQIIEILKKYEIIESFNSVEEIRAWISNLNELQITNLLSLNIEPNTIKFSKKLLINLDLLNTTDYLKSVMALVSIENADGFYHLFDKMLNLDFLNSPKFYQDIETLKRAESAQIPLWIIGEKDFIDSPYHDEDFELLVTVKDTSERHLDFVLREVIATIAGNADSIKSEYHRTDLETVVKYGSPALQLPNTYPHDSITYLAINKVSLNDIYHLENMEILANNSDIGNYLYPIMTNAEVIKKPFYRRIIDEMIEHKDNKYYAFMLCCYAVGLEEAKKAEYIDEHHFYYDINSGCDFDEILRQIDEKLNVIDGEFREANVYEIETSKPTEKPKSLLKKISRIISSNKK
jgi:hypothetical protein